MNIEINPDLNLNSITMQKMIFIYNALEDGWAIKKRKDLYIFTKNHEGKKELFLDSYLQKFVSENANFNKIGN